MQQSTGAVRPAPIRSQSARWSVHRLMPHLPVIFFIISIALFIGALAAASVPQRFEASTTLVLTDAHGVAALGDTPNAAAAIMATPDFAREVVSRLGLTSDALLTPRLLPPVIADWLVSHGLLPQVPEQQSEAELVHAYLEALGTSPAYDGRALIITITANDPQMAARAANVSAQVYLERRQAVANERDLALNQTRQKVLQAQASLQEALERERTFRTNAAGPETARQAHKAADDLALLIAERAARVVERDAIARQSEQPDHLTKTIAELETAIRLRQAIIAAAVDNAERQQALERAVESARLELSLQREILGDELLRLQTGETSAYVVSPADPPNKPDRTWPSIVGGITAVIIAACLFWLMSRARRSDHEDFAWSDGANEVASKPVAPFKDARECDVTSLDASETEPASSQPDEDIVVPPVVEAQPPFSVVQWSKEGAGAFSILLERLAIAPRSDGGAHLLVVGADEQANPLPFARELARYLAMRERVILLDLSEPAPTEDMQPSGLTDLIAGRASFAEIITRDSGSRLHQVSRGSSKVGGEQMGDAVELAMAALDQTYDWIVQTISLTEQDDLIQRAFRRADGTVLVAQGEMVDVKTFAVYESLREKGLENVAVVLTD